MAVVLFLNYARDRGAWNVAESGPRLKYKTGVLHLIPQNTRNLVDNIRFLKLVSHTELDPILSLLAWCR